MTQPIEGAVSGEAVETPQSPEDRLDAAFADPENHKEEEELPAEGEEEAPPAEEADDETELEAEADDLPPIDAPVSWDAEAKEVFKTLPREAQEIVQKREADRERFVQQKSQEAVRARSEAEKEAQTALAQREQQYAAHYQAISEQLNVPEPPLELLAQDQYAYFAQMQQHRNAQAQRQAAQQRAQELLGTAAQRMQGVTEAEAAEDHRQIVENFPEYLDPTTGPKLREELTAVARFLEYPPELISQARPTDILAMRKVAELKAKADKYDALQAKKMEKVRAAKDLPRVAKPGSAQAPGAARQNQYAADREALRRGDKDATQRVLDSYFTKSK